MLLEEGELEAEGDHSTGSALRDRGPILQDGLGTASSPSKQWEKAWSYPGSQEQQEMGPQREQERLQQKSRTTM